MLYGISGKIAAIGTIIGTQCSEAYYSHRDIHKGILATARYPPPTILPIAQYTPFKHTVQPSAIPPPSTPPTTPPPPTTNTRILKFYCDE